MKTSTKRLSWVVSMFLVLMMIFSGCGVDQAATPPASDTTAAPAATDTAAPAATDTAAPANTTPVTLSMFLNFSWMSVDWGNNQVSKAITDKTGVTLELSRPSADDNQQLNLLLASNSLPDMICINYQDPMRAKLEQSGKIMDMKPLIDEYAPEMAANLGPEFFKILQADDGKNYCYGCWTMTPKAPYAKVNKNCADGLVRSDLFDELGKPDLSNPDGLFNALVAIKKKHPDITPIAFTVPLQLDFFGQAFQQNINMFRAYYGNDPYYQKDGNIYAFYKDPKYNDFVKFMNKLYNAGLIGRDIFTLNSEKGSSIKEQGNVFYLVGQINNGGYVPKGKSDTSYINAPFFATTKMEPVGSLAWTATMITNNCKNPDRAVQLLSYCTSKEGDMLTMNGIQGKDWDTDANGEIYIPDPVLEKMKTDYAGLQKEEGFAMYFFAGNWSDHMMMTASMKSDPILKKAYDMFSPYSIENPAFLSIDPTGASPEGVLMQQISDQYVKDFPKIMMAKDPSTIDASINDMIKRYDDMGMPKIEAVWTTNANKRVAAFNNK